MSKRKAQEVQSSALIKMKGGDITEEAMGE
jgi:hypothetical protein